MKKMFSAFLAVLLLMMAMVPVYAAGQTALLVTHSEHEAQLMADHIGVVKMGQYQIKKATHPT